MSASTISQLIEYYTNLVNPRRHACLSVWIEEAHPYRAIDRIGGPERAVIWPVSCNGTAWTHVRTPWVYLIIRDQQAVYVWGYVQVAPLQVGLLTDPKIHRSDCLDALPGMYYSELVGIRLFYGDLCRPLHDTNLLELLDAPILERGRYLAGEDDPSSLPPVLTDRDMRTEKLVWLQVTLAVLALRNPALGPSMLQRIIRREVQLFRHRLATCFSPYLFEIADGLLREAGHEDGLQLASTEPMQPFVLSCIRETAERLSRCKDPYEKRCLEKKLAHFRDRTMDRPVWYKLPFELVLPAGAVKIEQLILIGGWCYLHQGDLFRLAPYWYGLKLKRNWDPWLDKRMTLSQDDIARFNAIGISGRLHAVFNGLNQAVFPQHSRSMDEVARVGPACVRKMITALRLPSRNKSDPKYLGDANRRLLYPTLLRAGVPAEELKRWMVKRATIVYPLPQHKAERNQIDGNLKYWSHPDRRGQCGRCSHLIEAGWCGYSTDIEDTVAPQQRCIQAMVPDAEPFVLVTPGQIVDVLNKTT